MGGTWFWNRYPGARCDVESLEYSYSFSDELEQEWQWTERYASQPEILRYLNYVADRFNLRTHIQLNTRVTAAGFDETANCWTVQMDGGSAVSAAFFILATGCLSKPKALEYKGLESFQGKWYYTGQWPHERVDFTGRRVAVIGTGSSGIQSIPVIAEQAAHLFVFQRTPNFSIPAQNRPLSGDVRQDWATNRGSYRQAARVSPFGMLVEQGTGSALAVAPEVRENEYEKRWQRGGLSMYGAFADLFVDPQANQTAAEFVRTKIRAAIRDPEVAERLLPKSYPIGTKRICSDTGYYETFNRDNVTLVDTCATPIEEITPTGLRTTAGEYHVDSIVCATGFDAITGALCHIDIQGRGGARLREKWSAGPRTYLGVATTGFPNLFMITGPGSPSVFSNMVVSIEQHVDWIGGCLAWMRDRHAAGIEPTEDAENAWVAHVNEVSGYTLFPQANSWYVGANVPGKVRVFMPYVGGVGAYREKCDAVARNGYEGFALSMARSSAA